MPQAVHDGVARGPCRQDARRPGHSPRTLSSATVGSSAWTCTGTVARVPGGGNRATASTPASRGLSAGEIGEPGAPADTQQPVRTG
jgi:hypothetical protein